MIIVECFKFLILLAMSYIVYSYCRLISFKLIKLCLVCLQCIIIILFISIIYYGNYLYLIELLTPQAIIIFTYIDYKKDKKMELLYKIISKSKMLILMAIGLNNIKIEKIYYVENMFKRLFNTEKYFSNKFNYVSLRHSENCIYIKIIFWSEKDYFTYIEGKKLEEFDINPEFIEKGVALEYEFKI